MYCWRVDCSESKFMLIHSYWKIVSQNFKTNYSGPCDVNPCHNNGTCRATSAFTEFFCECPNGFGGKLCDLEKGSLVKHKYGKNVQLISSGRQEWIDQLKKTKLEELEKKRKVQEGNEEERSLNTSIKSDEEGRGKMKLRQSGKEDDLIIKGFKEQGKQGKSHEMSAIPNHSSKLIQKTDSTVQSVLVGSFAGSIPKTSSTVHVVLEIYFTFLMFS
ncbi:hypothetical protein AB6A40_007195 [Gnathostoma spinigerum]|uniref:EGF-like domain-containing protein n=1 Tax=Gnathostoma spinigerum TaxID=75299 RepID=A0ABD6ESP8_9BILA